jgi:hypothetical protein
MSMSENEKDTERHRVWSWRKGSEMKKTVVVSVMVVLSAVAGGNTLTGPCNLVALDTAQSLVFGCSIADSQVSVVGYRDPSNPVNYPKITAHGRIEGITWQAGRLYLLQYGRWEAWDVATPANPVLLNRDTSLSGSRMTVEGNFLYVLSYSDSLYILDITDLRSPRRIGACLAVNPERIAVSGNCACLLGRNSLSVVDVANPAQPRLVGQCNVPQTFNPCLAVRGNYAYAGGDSGLRVIDVSTPSQPHEVGHERIAVWDDHGDSVYEEGIFSIALVGRYALAVDGNHLRVIDISTPEDPHDVAASPLLGIDVPFEDVAACGNYAFGASSYLGLFIINIADPLDPFQVAPALSFAGACYACVADGDSGLQMVVVTHSHNPHVVGHCLVTGAALCVTVAGNYAYVAGGGLSVIDISDPHHPREVGRCPLPDSGEGIAVTGGFAYVADGRSGLRVIDVADPQGPHEAGHWATNGPARAVALASRNRVYIAEDRAGLDLVDASSPFNLTELARWSSPDPVEQVAVDSGNDFVAAACRTSGLHLFHVEIFDNYVLGQPTGGKARTWLQEFKHLPMARASSIALTDGGLVTAGNPRYSYTDYDFIGLATPGNLTVVQHCKVANGKVDGVIPNWVDTTLGVVGQLSDSARREAVAADNLESNQVRIPYLYYAGTSPNRLAVVDFLSNPLHMQIKGQCDLPAPGRGVAFYRW